MIFISIKNKQKTLSPAGVFFYKMVTIYWEKEHFYKNPEFLTGLQFLCWTEPEQNCFSVEQIVLQHSVPLDIFFFKNEPLAFCELKRLFPVLIKAADKLFSMLESIWVSPISFCAMCILRSNNRLTDISFYQVLGSSVTET